MKNRENHHFDRDSYDGVDEKKDINFDKTNDEDDDLVIELLSTHKEYEQITNEKVTTTHYFILY